MRRTRKRSPLRGALLTIGLLLLAALWLFSAVSSLYRESGAEGREQLELALRRSAAACYASEGIYPPTLDYLTEHYGVQIEEKYVVYYDVFASNLMPDITVLEKDVQ